MSDAESEDVIEVLEDDPAAVFDVLEKLGEGAYGSVYKCRRLDDDSILAVKVVPLDSDIEGLKNEIEILRECQSDWIVAYQGCYEKDGDLWIAMEFMSAGSACDLLEKHGNFEEAKIAKVCLSVLRGLDYLHSRKKLHRDIKAGNILIDASGAIKLADFGVSAELKNTLSKRNTAIGTPFWMAPEVIQENDYDGRADVWSLGITCIEMAEGEPPYYNVHPMRAVFMIPTNPPPSLKETNKWSDEFNDFISQCLTKDVATRPTAQQLLEHPFVNGISAEEAVIEVPGIVDKPKPRVKVASPAPAKPANGSSAAKPRAGGSHEVAAGVSGYTPGASLQNAGMSGPGRRRQTEWANSLWNAMQELEDVVGKPTGPAAGGGRPRSRFDNQAAGQSTAAGSDDLMRATDELLNSLRANLPSRQKGGGLLSTGAVSPATASAAGRTQPVAVYRGRVSARSIVGEVLITEATTVTELMEMIAEELSVKPGFQLKKNHVLISPKQYSKKAVDFFRSDSDHAVVC